MQTCRGRAGAVHGVNQMRTPNIAMIATPCGFDAIYVDLEHNPTSLETAAAICVAALGIGITQLHGSARMTRTTPHGSSIAEPRV